MQTIKTATVVVLLLAVLYGVYVVLNKPSWPPNHPLSWKSDENEWNQEDSEVGPVRIQIGGSSDDTPVDDLTNDDGLNRFRSNEKNSQGLPKVEITTQSEASHGKTRPIRESISDVRPSTPAQVISPPSFLSPPSDKPENLATEELEVSELRSTSGDDAELSVATPTESSSRATRPKTEGLGSSTLAPSKPAVEVGDAAVKPSAGAKKNSAGDPQLSDAVVDHVGDSDNTEQSGSTKSAEASHDTATTRATKPFERALASAKTKLDANQHYEALLTLSVFYNNVDLTADEHQKLLDYLDPLAAKVIYSNEHLLEPAHEVETGETLSDIAKKHRVPMELLQNINGIEEPLSLTPGSKLKVVSGPFRAEVNLSRKELTLFVRRLYAGRFPITVGEDPAAPEVGDYQVQEKAPGRIYVGNDGNTIPAGDPRNPYGNVWIGLGDSIAIHGRPEGSQDVAAVSVGLDSIDARDVYGILTAGSNIQIR